MKIAWLFPGQGSQAAGMGRDVCEASPAARAVFAQADEALGEPLSRLCFDGPIEKLTLTANTQPAIVAVSLALLAALREKLGERLPAPDFAAGHSLGEYSALAAAGVLSAADAVRICRVRGAAMQAAVPPGRGSMAAIMGLEEDELRAICSEAAAGEVVSPANFNAPSQIVIAGHAGAVARASELAKKKGARAMALSVSAPFHCALMKPAREALATALAGAHLSEARFPVVANVDAEEKRTPDEVRRALCDQVDGPVRWVDTIRRMRAAGVSRALEIGPGRVLAGLCKRIDKDLEITSVGSVDAIEKVPGFLGLEQ